MTAARFCPRCGAPVPPDASFCPSCGNDLRPFRPQPAPAPSPQPAPQPAPLPQTEPGAQRDVPPGASGTGQGQSGSGAAPTPPPYTVTDLRSRSFEQDQRLWATLAHLAAFLGVPFPFVGNIVGPLILWVLKKNEMPFADRHGKAAVNFQISMTIYALVAFLLVFLVIGFILLPALLIFGVVMVIVNAIRANDGREASYPLAIQFLH